MATEGGGEPAKKYDRIIKIFKADIPESMQEKAILRVNQGMDKFQIEKVSVKRESKKRFANHRISENTCLTPLSLSISFPSLPPFYQPKPRPQDISTFVKKKCDEEFGGTWHVVCGRNFGCSITHDTKFILFFQIDQLHVMLFKSLE